MTDDERYESYVRWMRLTHNGHRSPTVPCGECGRAMTKAELAEYRGRKQRNTQVIDPGARRVRPVGRSPGRGGGKT